MYTLRVTMSAYPRSALMRLQQVPDLRFVTYDAVVATRSETHFKSINWKLKSTLISAGCCGTHGAATVCYNSRAPHTTICTAVCTISPHDHGSSGFNRQ